MINQTEMDFRGSGGGTSQNELLRDYFEAWPGQWIPMPELGRHIGAFAVHSRIADLRSKFGMNIENKTEVYYGDDVGPNGPRRSFYMYVPHVQSQAS